MIEAPLKTVGIEYPYASEVIARSQSYSFRISAPVDAKEVRLSIDDEGWQQCRKDDAHWWFDWTPQAPGEHVAVARVIEADGSLVVAEPRLFKVRP